MASRRSLLQSMDWLGFAASTTCVSESFARTAYQVSAGFQNMHPRLCGGNVMGLTSSFDSLGPSGRPVFWRRPRIMR